MSRPLQISHSAPRAVSHQFPNSYFSYFLIPNSLRLLDMMAFTPDHNISFWSKNSAAGKVNGGVCVSHLLHQPGDCLISLSNIFLSWQINTLACNIVHQDTRPATAIKKECSENKHFWLAEVICPILTTNDWLMHHMTDTVAAVITVKLRPLWFWTFGNTSRKFIRFFKEVLHCISSSEWL